MPIELRDVSHVYGQGTPFAHEAISDINLTIEDGEVLGIIGHTGSGKSTLVQHLNGLLKPTSGKILVDGVDITAQGVNLRDVRRKVGLVFQYPEHQLFEETVAADVAFGPKNLGLDSEEVEERVRTALTMVDLDYEKLKDRSPFELSGGQKRRVALAGVLAMQPKILVLDEPSAGLDPRSRDELLQLIVNLHDQYGMSIVFVTHNMSEVARLANRLVVMHKGRVVMDGTPREIFQRGSELESIGLGVPEITTLMKRLAAAGIDVDTSVLTVEEARDAVLAWLKRGKRGG
jgi:energy-coupling factor transport system ATP-binding protein